MIKTISQSISPKYFFKKLLRPNSYQTKSNIKKLRKKLRKHVKQNHKAAFSHL